MAEELVNHGMWELSDFSFRIGAVHEPKLDYLMTQFRLAQKAVEDRREIVKHFKVKQHPDYELWNLTQTMNQAKGMVMDHLLDNPHLLVIQRHQKVNG